MLWRWSGWFHTSQELCSGSLFSVLLSTQKAANPHPATQQNCSYESKWITFAAVISEEGEECKVTHKIQLLKLHSVKMVGVVCSIKGHDEVLYWIIPDLNFCGKLREGNLCYFWRLDIWRVRGRLPKRKKKKNNHEAWECAVFVILTMTLTQHSDFLVLSKRWNWVSQPPCMLFLPLHISSFLWERTNLGSGWTSLTCKMYPMSQCDVENDHH